MNPQAALLEFGLTPRQSAVYLALRALGAASVLQISRSTGIPRVSVYSCLDELERLGVVNHFQKNRRQVFEAHHPSMLLQMLKQKFAFFEEALPLFELLGSRSSDEFAFQCYEGREQSRQGQRDFYEALIREKVTQVRSFSHPDLGRKFPKFVPYMIQQRRQYGIHTQLLVPADQKNEIPAFFRGAGREIRLMPARFPFNCTCALGGQNALFIITQHKEPIVMLIRSKSISGLLTACFSALWEGAAESR